MTMVTMRIALLTAVVMLAISGNVSGESVSRSMRSKKLKLKTLPFFEKIAQDETVELLSHGPFTITATCDDSIYQEAAIRATVEADRKDEWVFGFPDYERLDDDGLCIGYHAAGTSESCPMFRAGAGTDNPSALQSLSGYYVGIVGHTIVFAIDYLDEGAQIYHQYTEEDLAQFPSEYKCVISGVLEYFDA